MRLLFGLLALACVGAPALAQPPAAPDLLPIEIPALQPENLPATPEAIATPEITPAEATPQQAQSGAAAVTEVGRLEDALDLAALAELRGGETIVIQNTTQSLNATNNGNTVTGDTVGSGALNVDRNAFTGFEGIGNFVLNTGHNNNLQGSIGISIVMTPQ